MSLIQIDYTKKKTIIKISKYILTHFLIFMIFFFCNPGCPGQLTRTAINPRIHWTPCKPSRQVRHRGGDRRARWGSNLGDKDKETLPLPLGYKLRCNIHDSWFQGWGLFFKNEITQKPLLISFFFFAF